MNADERIDELKATAYTIPTSEPESDGTLKWNSTTLVLVEISGMGKKGIGYTYAHSATAHFINEHLKDIVVGLSPFDIGKISDDILVSTRNEGNCGITRMAASAIDGAVWDLKARIFDVPLCSLIGKTRNKIEVYGSGGFTCFPDDVLADRLGGWADYGFSSVKMKIGRKPNHDLKRVRIAHEAIGDEVQLFVDANGAYDAKQALSMAEKFNQYNVTWFEEPVSSDDADGLAFIRDHMPAPIRIAAGEYGYTVDYFLNMLRKGAVDVLQADATRCGGITGFMKTAAIAEAFHIPFSFHCAPALHLHASLCVPNFYIGEYFYDHMRIENIFFEGAPKPVNGYLEADLSQPGLGLIFKYQDAEQYLVS
ncbi:MAG TPA: enolase C-terminal domain-like protein [Mucilaginibacter sp.]